MKKYLFIDRDGTLISEPPDEQIDSIEKVALIEGVIPALLKIKDYGYTFVMISNQDGLGTSSFPEKDFWPAHNFVLKLFSSQGIHFEDTLVCPHFAQDHCECRKPKIKLLRPYILERRYTLDSSFVIGDRESDIELAKNMGIEGIRIQMGLGWNEISKRICRGERQAKLERTSKETKVLVELDLDNAGEILVDTGLHFFDHMLEQLLKHSYTSGVIQCVGDLMIDDHHSIEDVGIALGECFAKALGEKRGIQRYGQLLPMDESLCQVALDLGNRFHFSFDGHFNREKVGDLSTEMIPHFFKSFAEGLKANLHIKVDGENCHHMAEAAFKAVAIALRQAKQLSGGSEIPSTKGMI